MNPQRHLGMHIGRNEYPFDLYMGCDCGHLCNYANTKYSMYECKHSINSCNCGGVCEECTECGECNKSWKLTYCGYRWRYPKALREDIIKKGQDYSYKSYSNAFTFFPKLISHEIIKYLI